MKPNKFLDRSEQDGFIVKTGNSGMQLKAVNYWFCAETGIFINNDKASDFKFVIAEPIDDNTGFTHFIAQAPKSVKKNLKNFLLR